MHQEYTSAPIPDEVSGQVVEYVTGCGLLRNRIFLEEAQFGLPYTSHPMNLFCSPHSQGQQPTKPYTTGKVKLSHRELNTELVHHRLSLYGFSLSSVPESPVPSPFIHSFIHTYMHCYDTHLLTAFTPGSAPGGKCKGNPDIVLPLRDFQPGGGVIQGNMHLFIILTGKRCDTNGLGRRGFGKGCCRKQWNLT